MNLISARIPSLTLFFEFVFKSENIQKLILDGIFSFSFSNNIPVFIKFLRGNNTLTDLQLNRTGQTNVHSLRQFFEYMKADLVLENLTLNSHKIGNELLVYIAEFLLSNITLLSIEFEDNDLSDYQLWREFVNEVSQRTTPIRFSIPASDLAQMRQKTSDAKIQTLMKDISACSRISKEVNFSDFSDLPRFPPRGQPHIFRPSLVLREDCDWLKELKTIPTICIKSLLTQLQTKFLLKDLITQLDT